MIENLRYAFLTKPTRDPLWEFEEVAGTDNAGGNSLFVERGTRVKDGQRLSPLPGMR